MASSPGKPRSCTGPILFTRTGAFFLKTLMEVAQKTQKFQIQLVWVSDYPFGVNIGIFFFCFLFHSFSENSPSSFTNREAAVIHFSPLMADDNQMGCAGVWLTLRSHQAWLLPVLLNTLILAIKPAECQHFPWKLFRKSLWRPNSYKIQIKCST